MEGIEEFETPSAEERSKANDETNERLKQALDDGSGDGSGDGDSSGDGDGSGSGSGFGSGYGFGYSDDGPPDPWDAAHVLALAGDLPQLPPGLDLSMPEGCEVARDYALAQGLRTIMEVTSGY